MYTCIISIHIIIIIVIISIIIQLDARRRRPGYPRAGAARGMDHIELQLYIPQRGV